MFRISLTLIISVIFFTGAMAQSQTITGTVYNKATELPLADALVLLKTQNATLKSTVTDQTGGFVLQQVLSGSYTLEVTKTGYEKVIFLLNVTESGPAERLAFYLEEQPYESQEVVVEAFRAAPKTPVTLSNLNKMDIQARYTGQDIPTLISTTPSINSYSDAGQGMGYSYFRLRGMDQTRINMTINGVPVNDAETQNFYTNNFADLASSASQIQIQRGVGTTTNGTSAFGGSLNVVTQNLDASPSFMLHSGYGSFNSRRNTMEYQTGRLAGGKLAFYGRLSDLASDGYREHSATHNQSYLISGGWFGKKSLLRFNAWGGISQSQLSYLPVDKQTLEKNHRANLLSPEEHDQFKQNFFQLQYTYHFSNKLNVSASAYYVRARDSYFDYLWYGADFSYLNAPADTIIRNGDTVTSTDFMARYKLDQDFYGGFASVNYTTEKLTISGGVHANSFSSDHYNQIVWAQTLPSAIQPNHVWYFNTGTKQEMSAFVKANYSVTKKLTLFGDVQARRATWKYAPRHMEFLFTDYKVEPMEWLFINPKVGARYEMSKAAAIYFNVGMTSREPTRTDYLRDDLAWRDVKQDDVKPETVYDMELGTKINTSRYWLNANVYYMLFENQIANTGYVNAIGSALTQNAGSSFRSGIELDGLWKITTRWSLTHASNFSYNRIQNFTQYFTISDEQGNPIGTAPTGVTFNNIQPALTPGIIVNQGVSFAPLPYLTLNASGRYVGKQYIDNTQSESLSIPEYFVADAGLTLRLEQWTKIGEQTLSLRVNNFTNTLYTPAGAINSWVPNTITQDVHGSRTVTTTPSYFPAATTSFFVTLMMKF